MSEAAPKSPARQSPPAPAIAVAAAKPAARMKLAQVIKGKLVRPLRTLIYGIDGVGKSSFAANAPAPIFIGAEDGTSELDVARFPEPRTWKDMLDGVAELTTSEHDYKTLVIDTLDWLEPLCWAHVCATKRDKRGKAYDDIEAFGYSKGYTAALDAWRELLAPMERLRLQRGMGVVLIAHSWVKNFKNPSGDDFDRYEIKLHPKASSLLREWCDVVLFATHETLTYEADGRTKGISSGARVVHTQRTAAWDAKNRYDLPEKLPLDWMTFSEAVAAHRPADPAALKARIAELLKHADDALKARIIAAQTRCGDDAAELARIANKLAATVTVTEAP